MLLVLQPRTEGIRSSERDWSFTLQDIWLSNQRAVEACTQAARKVQEVERPCIMDAKAAAARQRTSTWAAAE